MRQFLLSTLFAMLAIHSAAIGAGDPKRWHGDGMTVILHNGNKQFNTVAGSNPLDEKRTIKCKSDAGCLISLSSWATVSDNSITALAVCGLVDEKPAPPAC